MPLFEGKYIILSCSSLSFLISCSENFGLLRTPVMLCHHAFVLISGVGYQAASDCPHSLTVIFSHDLREGVIFAS
jgi:hypothetical protein